MILLQIIKLFSAYTTSNLQISQNVKDLIMKYTIGAVYKLSVMVKDDIDYNLSHIKDLTEDMSNLNKVRNNMNLQIDAISKAIEIENSKIDNIIMNMTNPTKINDSSVNSNLKGGKISSLDSNLTSTSSKININTETSLETQLKIRSPKLSVTPQNSDSGSENNINTESSSATPIQNKFSLKPDVYDGFTTPMSKLSDTSIDSSKSPLNVRYALDFLASSSISLIPLMSQFAAPMCQSELTISL